MKQDNKDIITALWVFCIVMCVLLICISICICFNSTYTISFTMDNNTLEAIKSINYSIIK